MPLASAVADWPPAPPLKPLPDEAGTLPASVRAELLPAQAPVAQEPASVAANVQRWRCTFRYHPATAASQVHLAGSFNGWNPSALALQGPDANGDWSGAVDLPPGTFEYKFVVDGQHWFSDPQNPEGVDDNHQGLNSVLRLGRLAHLKASDARVGDGQIDALAVEHHPERAQQLERLPGNRLLVRVQTLAHDVEQVWTAVEGDGLVEMTPASQNALYTLWEGIIAGPPPDPKAARLPQVRYTFVLKDGNLRASGPDVFGVSVSDKLAFRTPDWAKNAIWYQIFPERFRNGDPNNDREPVRPWTSEWFTMSPFEVAREKDGRTFWKYIIFDRQYGGDIAGLEAELPYLKDLGVNALYLNPIFQSESNHKYNAISYLHVDEHFGTKGDYAPVAATEDLNDPKTWKWTESDKRFLAFLKKAHALGFKVILDGVFNHVGTAHPAFEDVRKNGKASKYADWFEVTSWEPFKYQGWFGNGELPVFKKSKDGFASLQVKQHILNVTRRWMAPDGKVADGVDGWRLDVPNEVPAPFWTEWRELVKSINPDAYIVGEIWDRSESWLDGKHFDAVMNYEFARPAVAWLFNQKKKITPTEIDRRLRDLRLAYPHEATLVLQNLLDSHDTDRAASMALNPDRVYNEDDRVQQGAKYNDAKPAEREYARVRLAALLQMTYVGAPMIYYGDEVGMWGAADPTCRKPMLWQDLQPYEKPEENCVMPDQLAFYKAAIALRNAHPALRTGTFQTLLTDDAADVWAFLRKDANEQLVVVLNAGDKEAAVVVPLPTDAPRAWRGVFGTDQTIEVTGSAGEHKLQLSVPPVRGVVLHAATPK